MERFCEKCRCPEDQHTHGKDEDCGWALTPGGPLCREFTNGSALEFFAAAEEPFSRTRSSGPLQFERTWPPSVAPGGNIHAVNTLMLDPRTGRTYVIDIGS